jgi:hypothetical protein
VALQFGIYLEQFGGEQYGGGSVRNPPLAVAFDRHASRSTIMTNPNMVKDPGKAGDRKMPESNIPPPVPVPAPEDDPNLYTTQDPIDSPQPNPIINPEKTRGLHNS